MRIAAGIEYDGRRFSGWQAQKHAVRTVQGAVEQAFGKVANHPVSVICAGRTDTGVHGAGQVIHFDSDAERSERSWVFGANANLPEDVTVLWARPVDPAFHARFSALRRTYRYTIFNRTVRPSYLAGHVTWECRPLELAPMEAAARHLLGEHDFTSYRASECQAKSPVRTLYRLELHQHGPFITLELEANAFLHHMVRNIAGVLMAIGAGQAVPEWAQEVLEARDRRAGGVTARPDGLYLWSVTYPDAFDLPVLSPAVPVW